MMTAFLSVWARRLSVSSVHGSSSSASEGAGTPAAITHAAAVARAGRKGEKRLVYECPQMQLPDRRRTALDPVKLSRHQSDNALTEEARAIFSDMQDRGRIGSGVVLGRVFIARTAAAALEMDL